MVVLRLSLPYLQQTEQEARIHNACQQTEVQPEEKTSDCQSSADLQVAIKALVGTFEGAGLTERS